MKRPSLRRSPSLRTRVASAAALGATIVVLIVGVIVWTGIRRDQYHQLDQRLDSISSLLAPQFNAQLAGAAGPADANIAATARLGPLTLSTTSITLPQLPIGYANSDIAGTQYRVRTIELAASITLAVGTPVGSTEAQIGNLHHRVIAICLAAIAAAAVLGWLFAAFAIAPLRVLARRTDAVSHDGAVADGHFDVRGAREVEDIAAAIRSMLSRIGEERGRTAAALESARDFAAVSSHELRTPLTAMRTNLEVLQMTELDDASRAEILTDVLRTQSRIESTLAALERLAQGELATAADHEWFDLAELLDRAAQDAPRVYPQLATSVEPTGPVLMLGLPAGLRLVVDNAITNAVRHGHASAVVLGVHRSPADESTPTPGGVDLVIDDNGSGIPDTERDTLFDKFARGSTSSGGSGLGLALVAQQAALHGGSARLADSPLGGTRLIVHLPASRFS